MMHLPARLPAMQSLTRRSLPLLLRVLRVPATMRTISLKEWDLLIRQARRANLLASLHVLAESQKLLEHIPPEPLRHLSWARTLSNKHLEAVRWEVRQIRKALAATGVPVILLKGAAYVLGMLPASEGRMFSDVDIIVPKPRLPEVEAALMMNGWAASHHDEYDQRYYRQWMHEIPPMQHVQRNSVIDVHHAILPETAHLRPSSEKLCKAALPVDGCDELRVFCPTDMVLHSAVHLFHEGELDHGLRDLYDLHRLLTHFAAAEADFWPSLAARAQDLDLARPLFYALRYCGALLGTRVPAATLAAVAGAAPNAALLFLMDRLFLRALLPAHASCSDLLSSPARSMLYVRANWLRMPPVLLARHLFHKAFISEQPA